VLTLLQNSEPQKPSAPKKDDNNKDLAIGLGVGLGLGIPLLLGGTAFALMMLKKRRGGGDTLATVRVKPSA
jgi:hypothetical protein